MTISLCGDVAICHIERASSRTPLLLQLRSPVHDDRDRRPGVRRWAGTDEQKSLAVVRDGVLAVNKVRRRRPHSETRYERCRWHLALHQSTDLPPRRGEMRPFWVCRGAGLRLGRSMCLQKNVIAHVRAATQRFAQRRYCSVSATQYAAPIGRMSSLKTYCGWCTIGVSPFPSRQ